MKLSIPAALGALGLLLAPLPSAHAEITGWLSWRGPAQNGTSTEKGLPDKVDAKAPLWKVHCPGQSTPVIANGKLYIMGYFGEGPELQEGVTCYDAETGKQLWRQTYSDYLSDTIYLRYATSSPAIDPETGNVYIQGTQGILAAFTADGKLIWKHSLMESFGRLTFPNSRTASPLIDKDIVITRGIMANWGAQGPAGDRFYAFDKKTGDLIWASTTGERPKDNSYSHLYLGWQDGTRVFYTATGDGNVFCANARTGEPLWRVPLFRAGINATVLVHNNDKVISVFGTPYEPGKMIAIKMPKVAHTNGATAPVEVPLASVQLWEADVSTSSSSPILVGDRIYVVAEKGDLACIDANTGKIFWKHKLGIEQRNAALVYADGKLYVPILDDPSVKEGGGEAGSSGGLYVIRPTDAKPEILNQVTLDGRCFGTPVAFNGKVYVQTTRNLYCFGKAGNNSGLPAALPPEKWPAPGPATQLQVIPSEVLLRPGQAAAFRIRSLDAHGLPVADIKDVKAVKWAGYIPATAKVKASMKGGFDADGKLVAAPDPVPSAGAYEAVLGNLKGYIRARVLPYLPIKQDFESFPIAEKHETEPDTMYAYPPLPWIGARFKFEIREKDGNKMLTKTIDNKFFQRATVFIGEENTSNYTMEADVMSDGNKRKMSDVGIINQHYMIVLKGNEQKLEINSNQDCLRVPGANDPSNCKWSPGVWYRLKSRVDIAADGSAMVRAKAWKKDEAEPAAWTIEVPHKNGHTTGSPGLYGFAPQEMRVYIDNIAVTPNK